MSGSASSGGGFNWHSSDIHVQMAAHNAATGAGKHKAGGAGEDDVEVMSTDSSSSSSSDSQ